MKKWKYIIIFYFLFSCFLAYGFDFRNEPESVVSNTSLTQDVTSEYDPDIQIITAEQIELYGVENLPDLLRLFAGINVYRINASTAAIDVVGYADIFDSAPKILIDGKELEDPFITKDYLYNLPLSMEDIDRIEIVKGSSYYSDGGMSPAGIINIVTKSPELLDANYVTVGKGTDNLNKVNFSINKYFWDTYFKITGEYREIDEYNTDENVNQNKFLNLSLTKFIGDESLLTLNASISEGEGVFNDRFIFYILNMPMYYPYKIGSSGLKRREFFVSYKYPSFELTFLYKRFEGSAKADVYTNYYGIGTTKTDFYKFTLKKGFRLKRNKITVGFDDRYYNYDVYIGTSHTNIMSAYAKDEFRLNDNMLIRSLIKWYNVTDYATELDYFVSFNIHSKDNVYGVEFSYSKSNKLPRRIYNYSFSVDISKLPNFIPGATFTLNRAYIYGRDNMDFIKFYSSKAKMYYVKDKVDFQATFFFNRIKDMVFYTGDIDFLTGDVFFYPKNYTDFSIVGIESSIKYSLNKNTNFFISAFKQNLYVDNIEEGSYFLIPSYKFNAGFLFMNKYISGGVYFSHVPEIKDLNGESSDSYSELDLNLVKKFFDNRLVCSAYVKNLFNDVHKETSGGLNIGRSYFVKIKYNF